MWVAVCNTVTYARHVPGQYASRFDILDDGTFADETLYNEQQQLYQQLQQEQQQQVNFGFYFFYSRTFF